MIRELNCTVYVTADSHWSVEPDLLRLLGSVGCEPLRSGTLSAWRIVMTQFVGSFVDRNEAIVRIKAALKRRSRKAWSVTGGRGTSFGYIDVQAPPARRDRLGYTDGPDREELARLFGLRESVHCQGLAISPEERTSMVLAVEIV